MAENINISIGNVVRQGSVARVRMRWPTSTVNKTQVNEWPVLLNAIERTAFADATVDQGFTYTFPFALARGTGFPYCMSMQLEADPVTEEAAEEAVAVLG